MLVFRAVQELPRAAKGNGVLDVARPVLRQVLRPPERVGLPLILDVGIDRNLHVLGERKVQVHLVALPDSPVAVTVIIDRNVEKRVACLGVDDHIVVPPSNLKRVNTSVRLNFTMTGPASVSTSNEELFL